MIETVASVGLAIDERLTIYKNRIQPEQMTGNEKRICIVTGIHGDELEGQYVCYELNRVLKEQKEHVKGIVDIYPAMNPLGVDSITRGVPGFDIDMNRIFPGSDEGAVTEHMAGQIMGDIAGADFCVDIHASNIFLREILQVRMSEGTAERLLPYAKLLNTDFIWVHGAATVLESTLAYGLKCRRCANGGGGNGRGNEDYQKLRTSADRGNPVPDETAGNLGRQDNCTEGTADIGPQDNRSCPCQHTGNLHSIGRASGDGEGRRTDRRDFKSS